MKTWSMLVAVVMLALSASLVMGAAGPTATPMLRGKITKIDGANVTVQPAPTTNATASAPVTFATDANTVVNLVAHGKSEKKAVSDLLVGQIVYVKLSADSKTAVTISIFVKPSAE